MKSHKSLFFRDLGILGIMGLIPENAQGISPGTLLDFEEVQETADKKTLSDETRFNPTAPGILIIMLYFPLFCV